MAAGIALIVVWFVVSVAIMLFGAMGAAGARRADRAAKLVYVVVIAWTALVVVVGAMIIG